MKTRDWSVYLEKRDPNQRVKKCTNCNTLKPYVNRRGPSPYHYKWCDNCMRNAGVGPLQTRNKPSKNRWHHLSINRKY